uniref:CCHC-type domain-containing protein n=1 Tax=Denticeps clupeoides TaxID=299321 RepID=A0AAY4D6X3_9TELE
MSLQEKQMQLEAAKLRADREARGLREKELAHQLQLKQLELEEHDRERQLHLKQMELEERDRERQFERERQERDLEFKRLELELASKSVLSVESQTPVFDVSRHIRLVPPFSEDEVEKYFSHFERVATTLQWPKVVWTLLLQCVLVGKAQEVYSSLSLQQSSDYDVVKTSILNAYELVPEAYRQRFRKSRKGEQITYVEFAREKEALFNRWCVSSKVSTWEQLRELILLEEFKNCVPEAVATHLNDQKESTLAQAAICADEFVLTHKVVFCSVSRKPDRDVSFRRDRNVFRSSPVSFSDGRACFYCHETGHLIAKCPKLLKKHGSPPKSSPKGVGFVQSAVSVPTIVDPVYEPFVLAGTVSAAAGNSSAVPVRILRDTGAAQSFVLANVWPFSDDTFCGSYVLVRGIELGIVKVPLHVLNLHCALFSGSCKVAVRPELPMQGIDFILGNDLAGGKVLPLPEVIDNPAVPPSSVVPGYESVFPACAVTRAQARRQSTDELCDTFMAVSDPLVSRAAPSDGGVVEGAPRTRAVNVHDDETMSLPYPCSCCS